MVQRSRMLVPAGRQRRLLQMIEAEGQLIAATAVDEFGVSVDTIRRDLDQLSEEGLVLRTHGGAVRIQQHNQSPSPVGTRAATNRDAKARIARVAAEYVADGQTLLMNGGSSIVAAARELGQRRDLTILTNNLLVPGALPPGVTSDVYLLGGAVRLDSQVTVGPVVLPGLESTVHGISGDVAFIGVGGVSASGYSAINLAEAQMMSELMSSAARVVVLCDSSKFGRNVLAQVGSLSVAHVLVTDVAPPSELAAALHDADTEVRIAAA